MDEERPAGTKAAVIAGVKEGALTAAVCGAWAGVLTQPAVAAVLPTVLGVIVTSVIVGAGVRGYQEEVERQELYAVPQATTRISNVSAELSMTVTTMKEYPTNSTAQASGCTKLANAVVGSVDYDVIISSGLVEAVVEAMRVHKGDIFIQEEGSKALQALVDACCSNDEKKNSLEELGVMKAIKSALEIVGSNGVNHESAAGDKSDNEDVHKEKPAASKTSSRCTEEDIVHID